MAGESTRRRPTDCRPATRNEDERDRNCPRIARLAEPVADFPWQRAGPAGALQHRHGARDRHQDRRLGTPLAQIRGRWAAPDVVTVRGSSARPACRHGDTRSLRVDRLAGHGRAVRLALRDAGARLWRAGGRSDRRGADHQPAAAPARIADLAHRPLARLPGLAGRVYPRDHRSPLRPAYLVGRAGGVGVTGRRRDRPHGAPVPSRPASTSGQTRAKTEQVRSRRPVHGRALRPAATAQDRRAGRLPRLLPARRVGEPVTLGEHIASHGPLPARTGSRRWRQELLDEVELSGLSGRGGAGFPTARKLAAVASTGRNPIVIGNGTEGEPASAKDKVLMAQAPHLVLDGAVIAAWLVGAGEAVIAAHPAVSEIMAAAVAERGYGRTDRVRLRVIPAADGFVAGQASAVVQWIERGIPKPMATTRRLSERGLAGRPTLVQNVETLAHLALIARYGAGWFRAVGTPSEPGSMLVTLAGSVRRPGVCEVAIGTGIADLLDRAGGPTGPLGALLIGGYFGRWVDAAAAGTLRLCTESLGAVGASVGAGLG